MNRQETGSILSQFDIRPTRSLGQNFLVDDRVVDLILESADVGSGDLVLEIGPGIGSMTRALARKAGKVIALEIDKHVIPALSHVLADQQNARVIEGDALSMDFHDLTRDHSGPVKVVANLPYYITTPLIIKSLTDLPGMDRIVVMIQKEASDRILAHPGSRQYGPLAVLCESFGSPSRVMTVKAGSFFPRPNVDSCVIRIVQDAGLQNFDWTQFADFVEACFFQRRRTLLNSLKIAGIQSEMIETIRQTLQDLALPLNIRPEQISCDQFHTLFNQITD